ncbi:hypothetical protein [Candidatus Phytoplasma fabacearum]|uniref:hypothetical protein n=1 Tax=Candidatus Phytoplasma fabacearum TaxID=2982628 RepID=UPI00293ADDE2|nr:hypothetical protein [Pigeon pea little leaf phytoplasma]
MRILNQFIKKNKTLSTINKWLKAGFMKEGIKDESLSGSPQGGIISPPRWRNMGSHGLKTSTIN